MQRKKSNEKITRTKLSFSTYKNRCFSFLWTLSTFKSRNFLISYSL
jgi:hypothetical protein